ncbi:Uma2 family endonuclease [Leptolyngbya sp. FACHB-17]|uniref:Uma2 family endonuclease n=1 Tax=unclassified Leptolyngbya TaxID=2650499 RepID=UPI00241139D6|nr:Uma2 family endonuclease [Leptolyngbya sp. FACHB-17]
MVVVGEVAYHNNRRDIILNPQVIIEVLSQSTEDYDRLGKFASYRTIRSFVKYVLVDQNRIRVEHFTKQAAKRWLLQDLDAEDREIRLRSIPVSISLNDVYRNVNFSETEVSKTGNLAEMRSDRISTIAPHFPYL